MAGEQELLAQGSAQQCRRTMSGNRPLPELAHIQHTDGIPRTSPPPHQLGTTEVHCSAEEDEEEEEEEWM